MIFPMLFCKSKWYRGYLLDFGVGGPPIRFRGQLMSNFFFTFDFLKIDVETYQNCRCLDFGVVLIRLLALRSDRQAVVGEPYPRKTASCHIKMDDVIVSQSPCVQLG